MAYTDVQKFILFALGSCYEELNKKIAGKPLEVEVSKVAFIDLIKDTGIAKKGERALYRNLETLEKNRLIAYANKNLVLTKKGKAVYDKVNKQVQPYIELNTIVKTEHALKLTKKMRTALSWSKV